MFFTRPQVEQISDRRHLSTTLSSPSWNLCLLPSANGVERRKHAKTFSRSPAAHSHRQSKTTNDKIKKIDCCSKKAKENFPHIFFVFFSLVFVCLCWLCNKRIRFWRSFSFSSSSPKVSPETLPSEEKNWLILLHLLRKSLMLSSEKGRSELLFCSTRWLHKSG